MQFIFYLQCGLNNLICFHSGSVLDEELPQTPRWWDGEVTALYHRWRNFLDVLQKQKTEVHFKTHCNRTAANKKDLTWEYAAPILSLRECYRLIKWEKFKQQMIEGQFERRSTKLWPDHYFRATEWWTTINPQYAIKKYRIKYYWNKEGCKLSK